MLNLSIRKFVYILAGIGLAWMYLLYYTVAPTYAVECLKTLGAFALVQLVYIIWSWKRITGSYINAYTIFIIACYAFNLGQPILEIFDAIDASRSIIENYYWSLDVFCNATVISMAFIMAFHCGAILCVKNDKLSDRISSEQFSIDCNAIKRVALTIAIVTFPCYMYNTIIRMLISATLGYKAIYEGNIGTVRLFTLIGDYYTPAVICLYFAMEALKKNTLWIWLVIISTIAFPPLFIGARSNTMIIMAIILMIYLFFHRLSLQKCAILVCIIYVTLTIFAAIADNRGKASRSLNTFVEVEQNSSHPVFETLSEMGESIQPLQYCLELMPNPVPYKHGESYLYAFTTVIPNLGFWSIHPATKYANLGNWLQDYMDLLSGPGFSIVAEAYYNFGEWGFIIMIVLGYALTYFFRYVSKSELIKDPIRFIIAAVFLWFSIKMARNSFEFVVRAVFYYCLPMYLLMKYCAKSLRKDLKHEE